MTICCRTALPPRLELEVDAIFVGFDADTGVALSKCYASRKYMHREVAAAYGHDDAVLLVVTAERQHPSLRVDRGHLGAGVRHGRAPHRCASPRS